MRNTPARAPSPARLLALLAVLGGGLAGCRPFPAASSGELTAVAGKAALAAPAASTPAPRFVDRAAELGLRFAWGHRGKSPLTNLESFGHGGAFLDYDQDGWQDILLVADDRCALFRNEEAPEGGRRFREVSAEAGLAQLHAGGIPAAQRLPPGTPVPPGKEPPQWKGCAVGDFDGDGWPDVVLTGYEVLTLLRNVPRRRGGRAFVDHTAASGIRWRGWGSSAGFADYDGDGDLDLFVGRYVRFGPNDPRYCDIAHNVRGGCPPRVYYPERGSLYRNDGGRFTEVTGAAGLGNAGGKALALGWCDFNQDGYPDLYLANDGVPGELFRNDGGRFTDVGILAGVAFGVHGGAQAGMGVDWGDYDRDEKLDLVVTAFSHESYSLYRALGGYFENVSAPAGLAGPTMLPLGFGCRFLDYDNDGWLDLVFANGHVYDRSGEMDASTPFRQPSQLFRGRGDGSFEEVTDLAGEDFRRPRVARGLATGDYDNDGRVDILLMDEEGSVALLRNETPTPYGAYTLRLVAEGANRAAFGAMVWLEAPGGARVAQVSPVASYLSSSDPRVHFGAGPGPAPTGVLVRWPGGARERFPAPAAGRETVLRRGGGTAVQGEAASAP
jgi:hypothetical protein